LAGPVIITRAEPGNGQTAARLNGVGLPYICAPMLVITPTETKLPSLEEAQGLLFTSANGVRAFCAASDRRDLTAWCVGPATLTAARTAGFAKLEHADGNADDLADLVRLKANQADGKLLHVANKDAAGNLALSLRSTGFRVEFAPLYAAERVRFAPSGVLEALKSGESCTVLVHSAKGAAAFAGVLEEVDLSAHILVAVSEAAAHPLKGHGFGKIRIAERPNEAALMEALLSAYSAL